MSSIGFLNQSNADELLDNLEDQERIRYEDTIKTLESYNQTLNQYEKEWQELFKNRSEIYAQLLQKLTTIDHVLSSNWSYNSITEDYNYVVTLWRSFIEGSFDNISGRIIERKFPKVMSYKPFSSELGVSIQEIEYAETLYKKATRRVLNQTANFDLEQEKNSLNYNKILLYSGKLRSKLYQRPSQLK